MVCDGDVLQTAGAGRRDHLFQCRLAIGRGRVHMQVTADIGKFDQLGQLPGTGPLEFLPGLAEFRRKPGQL